jgi:hypothetical protein
MKTEKGDATLFPIKVDASTNSKERGSVTPSPDLTFYWLSASKKGKRLFFPLPPKKGLRPLIPLLFQEEGLLFSGAGLGYDAPRPSAAPPCPRVTGTEVLTMAHDEGTGKAWLGTFLLSLALWGGALFCMILLGHHLAKLAGGH